MAQPLVCRFASWPHMFAIITGLWLSGSVLLPATHAQEAPTVTISLESVTLDEFGAVTVTSTLACSKPAVVNSVDVQVIQPVTRFISIRGYGFENSGACDVKPVPFEIVVVPQNGRFTPSIAYVIVSAFVCTTPSISEACGSDAVTQPLRLTDAP